MSGSPLRSVHAGESIVLRAASVNAWNQAAEIVLAGGTRGGGAARADVFGGGVANVRIKNASEEDVPRYGILKIDNSEVVFDPEDDDAVKAFQESPVLVGMVPASEPDGLFVVTSEPIAAGAMGFGMLSGLVAVSLDITDEHHTHATMKDGNVEELSSAMFGHRIYYKPNPGTGVKQAYVCLGHRSCNPYKAVASGVIETESGGTFNFAYGNFGFLTEIEESFSGWYPGGEEGADIPDGTELFVSWIQGQWIISPVECPE